MNQAFDATLEAIDNGMQFSWLAQDNSALRMYAESLSAEWQAE